MENNAAVRPIVTGPAMVVMTNRGMSQAHRDTPGVVPDSRVDCCVEFCVDSRGGVGGDVDEVVCAEVAGLLAHP